MERNWKLGDDLNTYDNVLDPITFGDLILMAQNINPAGGSDLTNEFADLLDEKVLEAKEMFSSNYEEIMREAFPDEYIDKKEFRLPPDEIEKLAIEIREFLLNNKLWIDVRIYFNGKCFSTSDRDGNKHYYNDSEHLITIEDIDPRRYFEYADGCLSMSFEGDFYSIMNNDGGYKLEEEFSAIDRKSVV